jgi:lysozyme
VLLHATVASAGQQCTSGAPPAGVDLNPDSSQPNWVSAKTEITFGIVKASQGDTFTAPGFATSWAAMKSAGVIRGAYHFFDPTVSGTVQADYFLSILGTSEPGDLPPTLDIECPTSNTQPDSANCLGNGHSGAATGAQITTAMNDFINEIVLKTGRKPLIYSYRSYFADLGVDTTGLQNYPLWIADYSGTSCFTVPSPWTTATFWQYGDTGTVSGISGAVDQDYFMGTLAQLTAFTNSGTTPVGDAGTTGADSGVDVVPDAGGTPCSLPNGDPGECLDVSVCDMLGGTYMPTAGYCPGASNIQCCTGMPAAATSDAGTTSDAGKPGSGTGGTSDGGSVTGSGTGSGSGSSSPDAGLTAEGGLADGGIPGSPFPVDGSTGGCAVSRVSSGTTAGDRGAALALFAVGLAFATRRRRDPR